MRLKLWMRNLRSKFLRLFRRDEMSLGRVHGTLVITEGFDKLVLKVNEDPMRLTAGLVQVQKVLKTWTDKTTEKQKRDIAMTYASVIFGTEQAKKLLDFYHGDAACVINVCAQYFARTLSRLINKAQKRMKYAETV